MQEALSVIAIICFVLGGVCLAIAVTFFFTFRIRSVHQELKGTLAQRQIAEIRSKRDSAARQREKINVFEELEKQAKPRDNTAEKVRLYAPTEVISQDAETVLLQQSARAVNPNFIIEKSVVFVSTNEVI